VITLVAGAVTSSGIALATRNADASGAHIDLSSHHKPINPAEPSQPEATDPDPGTPELVTPLDDVTGGSSSAMVTSLMAGSEIDTHRQIAEETARRPRAAMPTIGSLTTEFGERWDSFHAGIDIANAIGTPILAASAGMVIDAGPAQGFGNWVRIMSDEGTMTVYGHMEEVLASTGQRVQAGDTIALMGNRGFSTGPHLHLEVWVNEGRDPTDPLKWLREHGVDPYISLATLSRARN
jgi:murein DD-endopeptidase MepM/ murein hydrolase activator NlpD